MTADRWGRLSILVDKGWVSVALASPQSPTLREAMILDRLARSFGCEVEVDEFIGHHVAGELPEVADAIARIDRLDWLRVLSGAADLDRRGVDRLHRGATRLLYAAYAVVDDALYARLTAGIPAPIAGDGR